MDLSDRNGIGGIFALGEPGLRRRPGARPRDLLLGLSGILADGTPFCGTSIGCGGLTPCPDGTCPPGFVCQVNTCCFDVDVCVPEDVKCEGAAAPQLPPGTSTTTGIVGE